jgi:CHAT domain-containing protein
MAANEHETYLSIIEIANSLYKISSDSKYITTAFRYAEYSKYAVLRELKNDEMAKGVAGIPDSIRENERNMELQISNTRRQVEVESKLEHPNRSKIEEWNRQLLTLTLKLEGQVQLLEKNYPAYYKLKYSNQVVSIPQLQKKMEEKEAIIEYVLSDNALYTFAITKDTFQLVRQDADTAFFSKLNHFTNSLHNDLSSDYVEFRDAAYYLYQKLILSVEPLLKGKNLLIIPDGELNLIAFDVLTDKSNSGRNGCNYANESYLIKKYPIGYASSATLYSYSLGDNRKGNPSFLGIAPEFRVMRDSLGWLPFGERSVKRLAWLTFGRSLTGRNATKENFIRQCGRYDIIHIYTHGFEDTLNPANSRLVMAKSKGTTDAYRLHAWEVYNMQLNARMVVLASCYSGSGKLSKGEGVMSMSRSFMYAGSQSVVASLWIAYDNSMDDILNSFYLNLFKGMRKDEALRLAKLEYLKNTQSFFVYPHFWAGLVVNGNQNALYHYWYLKKIALAITIIIALTLVCWKRRVIKKLVGRIGSQL